MRMYNSGYKEVRLTYTKDQPVIPQPELLDTRLGITVSGLPNGQRSL
jgi:hypothetical protein